MCGGGGGDDDDEIKGACVLHRTYVSITLLIGLEQLASRVTGRSKFPLPDPHIPGSRPLHFGLPLLFPCPLRFCPFSITKYFKSIVSLLRISSLFSRFPPFQNSYLPLFPLPPPLPLPPPILSLPPPLCPLSSPTSSDNRFFRFPFSSSFILSSIPSRVSSSDSIILWGSLWQTAAKRKSDLGEAGQNKHYEIPLTSTYKPWDYTSL